MPGQDVKPLVAELRDRMEEELDYRDEAANQRAFAEVFADDPHIAVPRVVARRPGDGERVGQRAKLSDVIANGTAAERDQAGALLSGSTTRLPRGPACCTPTRTRATSRSCPTDGCWCSTSAPSPGYPRVCRARCR